MFITMFTTARYPRLCVTFRKKPFVYGEELLAPRPTPKKGGPPLVGFRDGLVSVRPINPINKFESV